MGMDFEKAKAGDAPEEFRKEKMPSVLMVGAAVTQEVMDLLKRVDRTPQEQTYRFHWAVINAMEEASGSMIDIYSTVPTRDFPYTRKLFWGFQRVREASRPGRAFIIMPFVNLLGLKQITRLISCLWFTFGWILARRKDPSKVIVLYGLLVSHLYACLFLGFLFRVKVVAIITDPPTQKQVDENLLYALPRKLDRWLLLKCLNWLDGIVVLAEATSRLLAPGVPAIVVEAMISNEVMEFCRSHSEPSLPSSSDAPFVIMYAGQMDEKLYGLEILLEAFQQLDGPTFALWLFGRGRLAERVSQAAVDDPRIVYWGFQGPEKVFTSMQKADVMVNARPLDALVTPFSFPSKILEYLAMGKLVVSARLPGIPPEYYPHLALLEEMTPQNLAARLREMAVWGPERKTQMEASARAFAWANKTQLQQGRRLCAFLETINHGS